MNRKQLNHRIILITVLWGLSLFMAAHSGYSAAEPIEQLPQDILRLGEGIGRIPKSTYSPHEASELIRSTVNTLWNFAKPDAQLPVSSGDYQRPKGLVVRYSF